ncbi:MAG: DUF6273 domain-containing protein [Clostridiales bacterium]|nr:DUF6273 domain-containing protein [Clostridiales bacterium]
MKSFNQKSSRLLLALAACAALSFAACSNSSDNTIPTGATGGATPTTNGGGTTTTTETPGAPETPATPATYTITVGSFENGTVVASPTSAASGTTVTLTATPASGCALSSISVTAADSSAVTLSGSGNARTFTMPAQNVTVSAAFAALLSGGAYTALAAGTDGSAGTSGTYVTFGLWPQTIKGSAVTVDESVSITVGAFTYYKGSDNCWYAKLAENAYGSGYTYSDESTVGQGGTSYKYFKVEPIKWRVLTDNYSGKKLLLAESILIGKRYAASSNNYANSEIRAWLNDGFLNAAFISSQQSAIATTTVDNSAASTTDSGGSITQATSYACENTSDKIFLLSELEATTSAYGFDVYDAEGGGNARIRKTTDYAKASGAQQSGWWWLRSPCDSSGDVRDVNGWGNTENLNTVSHSGGGVVPALSVN